jgi:hypothetical protein
VLPEALLAKVLLGFTAVRKFSIRDHTVIESASADSRFPLWPSVSCYSHDSIEAS